MSDVKQKKKDFTIDEKKTLIASITGYERNIVEGFFLTSQLLDSLTTITHNFRSLNLNQDEIMNISYAYDEITSNISEITQTFIETLDLIFNSKSLIESTERLEEKFMNEDELNHVINQLELFNKMNEIHKVKIRENYLKVIDSQYEYDEEED
ncbi:hypothetical protein [Staphylococcus warneri]|uniref:hypothetical protein n=1 Tax=Staphylococcus warneri TaxID=1292 RepID=UPI001673F65A|nr:hypothetical protein [Staphylococcus warneri]